MLGGRDRRDGRFASSLSSISTSFIALAESSLLVEASKADASKSAVLALLVVALLFPAAGGVVTGVLAPPGSVTSPSPTAFTNNSSPV